ncbi:hypothetical protein F5X99DRAFT_35089 [Biscogniauxia marginata]|nr:hypothetical protein F5X99DRAFT_35089 [Biscogniauxia marginata]
MNSTETSTTAVVLGMTINGSDISGWRSIQRFDEWRLTVILEPHKILRRYEAGEPDEIANS